jgi:hypothetical protein
MADPIGLVGFSPLDRERECPPPIKAQASARALGD